MSEIRSLMLPAEAAEYLRKPVRTLEQWRYRGVGPRFLKVGGRDVRYRLSDIEEWLEQQAGTVASR